MGTALAREGTLAEMLRLCCEVIVRQLNAAFARIWTLNEREQMLELQASAGMYTHSTARMDACPSVNSRSDSSPKNESRI